MQPDVIFITIDSLRNDKISNNERTCKTPILDTLRDDGIYFSQTISSADQTGTSLASVFTGLYPTKSRITHFNIKEDIKTFFDDIKDEGYSIFGILPEDSFFETISKNFDKRIIYPRVGQHWQHLDDGLGEDVLSFLKSENKSEPWFLYIHIMDIKAPKIFVPKEFDNETFGNTKYERALSAIDSWLGKIITKIDKEKTLIVLSSDHGEYIPVVENNENLQSVQKAISKSTKSIPFLEKIGMKTIINLRFAAQTYQKEKLKRTKTPYEMRSFNSRGTKDLFDELVRIPLFFTGYGIKNSKKISDLVRQVDIFPTILDVIQIEKKQSDIDGRSLFPLIKGEKMEEKFAYIETGINLGQLMDSKNPKAFGKTIGIRSSNYKYLRSRDDEKENVRLYDLKNDPLELSNIVEEKPSIVKEMEESLKQIIGKKEEEEMDKEELEATMTELKKLGYI